MRVYIYITAAIFIATMVWAYQSSLTKVQLLTKELAQTQLFLDTSKSVINTLREELGEQAKRDSQLQTEINQSEARVNELKSLLAKHDLEFLAQQKPVLIERRINDATSKVFDDLERITNGN